MTTKELIRAEIGRLEKMDYPVDTYEQSVGFYNALDRIKAFLDTLPDEPVTDCHDLKEAAEKSWVPEDAWQTARQATKTLNAMNLGIKFYGNLFPYLRKRGKLPLCCKKQGRLWLYETDKIAWLVKNGKLDYKQTWI